MKNKINIKDYIGWGIAVVFGVATLMLGYKNIKLDSNMQKIHNNAQTIQQYITNNNYNFPENFIHAVDVINTASGPVVEVRSFKDVK